MEHRKRRTWKLGTELAGIQEQVVEERAFLLRTSHYGPSHGPGPIPLSFPWKLHRPSSAPAALLGWSSSAFIMSGSF